MVCVWFFFFFKFFSKSRRAQRRSCCGRSWMDWWWGEGRVGKNARFEGGSFAGLSSRRGLSLSRAHSVSQPSRSSSDTPQRSSPPRRPGRSVPTPSLPDLPTVRMLADNTVTLYTHDGPRQDETRVWRTRCIVYF